MSKYLELFNGSFDDSIIEKTKPENKPYIAYSIKDGKMAYTVVLAKDPVVEGPADNEIWYKTNNNEKIKLTDKYYAYNEERWYGIPGELGFEDWHDDEGNIYYVVDHYLDSKTGYYVIKFDKTLISTCWITWTFAGYGGLERDFDTRFVEVILPNSIERIGEECFRQSGENTSLMVSNNLNYLGRASLGCISNIYYNGTISQWNIILSNSTIEWYDVMSERIITVHCVDGDVEFKTYEE